MKVPGSRVSVAVGSTKSGFSVYKSLRECLIDFKIHQHRFCRGMSRQEYLSYLDRVYAPNQNYIEKIFGVNL